MKYSAFLFNSDKEEIKELVITKLQCFFNNYKIAKTGLLIIAFLLTWQLYSYCVLLINYKNWQLPELQQLYQSSSDKNNKPDSSKSTYIISKHLFGLVEKSLGSLTDALKTSLPITLKGVIADISNPKVGQAIIQSADNKQKVYSVSDRLTGIPGQVTLEYIYKEKVYIKNNGVLEYLLYPVIDLSSSLDLINSVNSADSASLTSLTRMHHKKTNNNFRRASVQSGQSGSVEAPMDHDEYDEDQDQDININNTSSSNSDSNLNQNKNLKEDQSQSQGLNNYNNYRDPTILRPKTISNKDRINKQIKKIYN